LAAWMLVARPLNYRLGDAVSAHVAPRNGGASVSGANRVHDASGTLSSSCALRYNDQMQANAVSQRAAWVQLPRLPNYSVSDAARRTLRPEMVARRFGGNWSDCSTWGTKQQLCALPSCLDAGKRYRSDSCVCAAGSDLQRERCCIGTHVRPEMAVHLLWGQVGYLKHRRQPAAALR